jgi:hypothetical protein
MAGVTSERVCVRVLWCVQIVVPEQFVGVVLSDLTSARRAQVQCLSEGVGGERTVLAQVPLATLLVSGPATHSAQHNWQPTGLCQTPAQYDEWFCQFHYVVCWPSTNGQPPTERCS